MKNRTHESGFTLIEVLIASAIIVASMGVLLQLFGSGLDRMHRAGQHAHLLAAQRTILHTLEVVNPALVEKGEGVAEGLSYRWKASVSQPFRSIVEVETEQVREFALFTITIEVDALRGNKHNFALDRIGWRDGGYYQP